MQVGNWSDIFMYVGRRSFRHFSCRKVQDSIHHLQNYLCIELAFQNFSLLSSLTSASSETNSSIVFPSFNNLEWETFIQQGPMRPLLFQVRTYLVQPQSKIHFIIHRCRSSEKTTKLVNKKLSPNWIYLSRGSICHTTLCPRMASSLRNNYISKHFFQVAVVVLGPKLQESVVGRGPGGW